MYKRQAFIEYRIPLFEKLSLDYDISFYFEWFDSSLSRSKPTFKFQFLKSTKITNNYSFSPLLFFYLLKGRYNLFIAGAIGQINTYITNLVSRLLRKPFIYWDENWYWPSTKLRRLAWPIILQTLKNAQAIVVPGSKAKDFYLSINPQLKNKIFIAPNTSLLPENQNIHAQADLLRKSLKLNGKKVILYCGRLIRVKGFEHLIKAFSKLQQYDADTVLLVMGGMYGSGSKYSPEEIKSMYSIYGDDKVQFTGTIRNPRKAAYFLLADVVVVPSIFMADEYEVWGFAVNESMSVGKPVIATTAVGAAYDLIQNGINGYIVPDKDSEALFQAIKMVIADSSKQKEMGAQSLLILQKGFTYKSMSLGFKKAIKFALSKFSQKKHTT